MKKALRSPVAYVLLAGVLLLLAINLLRGGPHVDKLTLNTFIQDINEGKVASATLHDSSATVTGQLKAADGSNGVHYQVTYPERYASSLTQQLIDHKVPQVGSKHSKGSVWVSVLLNFLPILLLFGGFLFILNSMQGGGSRVMQFGKAKPRTVSKDQPKVTFADVAGADEAV